MVVKQIPIVNYLLLNDYFEELGLHSHLAYIIYIYIYIYGYRILSYYRYTVDLQIDIPLICSSLLYSARVLI